MRLVAAAVLLLAAQAPDAVARGWAWPDGSESVRIDTKVRFLDERHDADKGKRGSNIQSDEVHNPFNEGAGDRQYHHHSSGRSPALIASNHRGAYRVDNSAVYPVHNTKYASGGYASGGNSGSDNVNDPNNLDSPQFCKCVNTPECNPRENSAEICGMGKFLCCYKRPNPHSQHDSEFFNEIEDERPVLYPGKEEFRSPFPPPPHSGDFRARPELSDSRPRPVLTGPGGATGHIGPDNHNHAGYTHRQVLSGPDGPTGQIGPAHKQIPVNNYPSNLGSHQQVLVGPDGPTGNIGPPRQVLVGPNGPNGDVVPQVLVGPEGPTGNIGPSHVAHSANIQTDESAQRGILVGPGGPTGIIGPYNQRQVLVGPGGPTGQIGPRGGGRGLLIGPGGPTGNIGPGYGRQSGPGLLVGPGGPTGTIGPGRRLLVGPLGPTGRIGPHRYYGNYS